MILENMKHYVDWGMGTPIAAPFYYPSAQSRASISSSEECRIYSVLQSLSHLEHMYPGFKTWYTNKVVPGLATGTRQIFAEYCGDRPVAVVIAKLATKERKLCTIWVDDDQRGSGASQGLIKSAIKWLDCDAPLVTAGEAAREMLLPTFMRLGFKETDRKFGMYAAGSAEYLFNSRPSSLWRN